MMASLGIPKVFIITYDDGKGTQTLTVPKFQFDKFTAFRTNIISMKCVSCDSTNCVHCKIGDAS